jgi:hypothetical protein
MHVGVAYLSAGRVMLSRVRIRSDRVMHAMVWNGRKIDVLEEMSGQRITEQG